MFNGICPYASQIIVYGEGMPYCVALVSLDSEAINEWAAKNGLGDKSLPQRSRATRRPGNMIGGYVDTLEQANLNRWEQIKKFAVIDRELSVGQGI